MLQCSVHVHTQQCHLCNVPMHDCTPVALCNLCSLLQGASASSTPPAARRVVNARRLSPVPDIYSTPVTSPSSMAKNQLQELLQKSIFNYPPPVYDHLPARGPSHKREFTCKCVVKDHRDHVIHETLGSGSTKKEADMNAAKEMIPFIQAMLEGGGQLTLVS